MAILLAVVSDRFYRTTKQCFFTRGALFLGERLFVDKRIAVSVGAAETFWRRVATYVAVDTRRIDIVSAGHVFLHTFVSIRQLFLLPSNIHPQITQITQIQEIVNRQTKTMSYCLIESV